MTLEMLSGFVGVVVSLGLAYVPKLSEWYDTLNRQQKGLLALGIGLGVVAGAFGLSCAAIRSDFVCDQKGGWEAVQLFFVYAIANQITYLAIIRGKKVRV